MSLDKSTSSCPIATRKIRPTHLAFEFSGFFKSLCLRAPSNFTISLKRTVLTISCFTLRKSGLIIFDDYLVLSQLTARVGRSHNLMWMWSLSAVEVVAD